MNKEEKEAIEYIKAFQKDLYGASEKNLMAIYIDRVWNYIDKLQKENEELKEDKAVLSKEILTDKAKIVSLKQKNEELKELVGVTTIRIKPEDITMVADNFISKDKIRTKIKELEASYKKYEREGLSNFIDKLDIGTRIEVLEELLGDDEQ